MFYGNVKGKLMSVSDKSWKNKDTGVLVSKMQANIFVEGSDALVPIVLKPDSKFLKEKVGTDLDVPIEFGSFSYSPNNATQVIKER